MLKLCNLLPYCLNPQNQMSHSHLKTPGLKRLRHYHQMVRSKLQNIKKGEQCENTEQWKIFGLHLPKSFLFACRWVLKQPLVNIKYSQASSLFSFSSSVRVFKIGLTPGRRQRRFFHPFFLLCRKINTFLKIQYTDFSASN